MSSGACVLICGGAGFLGSHLVRAFLQNGAEVAVIDPCKPDTGGRPENLASLEGAITWWRFGADNRSGVIAALERADIVVDAMGFTRHHMGNAQPFLDLELNYVPHLHLALCLNEVPKPVVLLGSRGQFAGVAGPVRADSPQSPNDLQGVHKIAAESAMRFYANRFGWPCLAIRLDNCFGPGQLTDGADIGLIGGFIRSLLRGERVDIYGGPDRARTISYAPDIARQIVGLTAGRRAGFEALNVYGQDVGLAALLDLLIARIGRGSYGYAPYPVGEAIKDAVVAPEDGDAARTAKAGFSPTPLPVAIDATVSYFEQALP